MLDRNHGPTKTYAFLVSAELEDGKATIDLVENKLSDALMYLEGVGDISIESLGVIEAYEEPDEQS